MSLDNFYRLRKNFIILGLTGKMRSGSDIIVKLLSQNKLSVEQLNFLDNFQNVYQEISYSESRKIRRIVDFYKYPDNWIKFEVLDYRNVVLLFILHYNFNENEDKFATNICNWIYKLGSYKEFHYPRFGSNHEISKGSKSFLFNKLKNTILSNLKLFEISFNKDENLLEFLKNNRKDFFFTKKYSDFSKILFDQLDFFNPYLRYRLIHITAYLLRRFGTLDIEIIKKDSDEDSLNNIFTVADVINRLIKNHRNYGNHSNKTAHVIIDRLKNSYELTYFKEKYSGFYMIGSNAKEELRKIRIDDKFQKLKTNKEFVIDLDEKEFKVNEFKKGKFEGFDVENCLQKVDYHTYLSNLNSDNQIISEYKKAAKKISKKKLNKTNQFYVYVPVALPFLGHL